MDLRRGPHLHPLRDRVELMGIASWTKLASGLIVPPVRHLHHPCCRKQFKGPCPYCETSIPQQVQLEISGLGDADPPWDEYCNFTCGSLNTTFILDWHRVCRYWPVCMWRYKFDPPFCVYHGWLTFNLMGIPTSSVFVELIGGTLDPCWSTRTIFFKDAVTSPLHCQDLNITLPAAAGPAQCSLDGASCKVTAL